MAYLSGNRLKCVFPARAMCYKVGASGTINLPRTFARYYGPLIACDPTGANTVSATMLPPVGPLASNPPRAELTIEPGTSSDVLLIMI